MSTSTKTLPDSGKHPLKEVISELVLAYNQRRQSILDSYNVIESDIEILRYLDDEEQQKKMKELGEKFKIKLSTLTSIIDKLEKNKLVKRKNSKKDRRVIFIQPTSNAKKLLFELAHTTNGLAKVIEGTMDDQEYSAMVKGLNIILDHLSTAKM